MITVYIISWSKDHWNRTAKKYSNDIASLHCLSCESNISIASDYQLPACHDTICNLHSMFRMTWQIHSGVCEQLGGNIVELVRTKFLPQGRKQGRKRSAANVVGVWKILDCEEIFFELLATNVQVAIKIAHNMKAHIGNLLPYFEGKGYRPELLSSNNSYKVIVSLAHLFDQNFQQACKIICDV